MANDSIHLLPLPDDINVITVNEFHTRVALLYIYYARGNSLKRLPWK